MMYCLRHKVTKEIYSYELRGRMCIIKLCNKNHRWTTTSRSDAKLVLAGNGNGTLALPRNTFTGSHIEVARI